MESGLNSMAITLYLIRKRARETSLNALRVGEGFPEGAPAFFRHDPHPYARNASWSCDFHIGVYDCIMAYLTRPIKEMVTGRITDSKSSKWLTGQFSTKGPELQSGPFHFFAAATSGGLLGIGRILSGKTF